MKPMLAFVFDNEELKHKFAVWMCDGGGEQEFMQIEKNASFDYHQGRKFLENNVIEVSIVGEDE
jgi:hypothetical protein